MAFLLVLWPLLLAAQPTFTRQQFGDGFLFGTATASYQIEGAVKEGGRGPSIWDTFTHTKGKIARGENGDVTADFYHRYADDLALLDSMHFKNFRFSISWSRIFPDGTGTPNPEGVAFYHRVIDACLQRGITPWITIYHWDLPQALQDKGGWTNREILVWFADYADFLTKTYGAKVKHWMVLNEPTAFTAGGYFAGIHAPGEKGLKNFLKAAHHAALCQAEGGRIIRHNVPGALVGTTFSCADEQAYRPHKKSDRRTRRRFEAVFNRMFIEPALGMGYPVDALPVLKKIEKKIARPGDMERLQFDFDFIGVQTYTRQVVKHSIWPPIIWGKEIKPAERGILPENITEMGWEAYPEGIYYLLKHFAAYKGVHRIIVTENGAAFPDRVENGAVNDTRRLQYYQEYLAQVLRAKNEGVPVDGYFCWTLMDNFEWAEGYKPRFGLVYVDFATQQRIVKKSGRWFQAFLK